ncbi:MAG: aquaporin [Balneola sp.]|nr:aquaporin [Balneola sp.]MBO6650336.1 aquaporin [Balneola sp.]MBO6712077.1 aquaporin [Balneola sp.]MBO6800271.1 aquaporin [Balneola sp.]MBO6869715.1 aquaporin [Balneola sp.]
MKDIIGLFLGLRNNKYLVELVGSYFLVLTYGISGDAFAIGFILSAFIYIGALTSGAHYNPAISVGAFFLKRITATELLGYIVSQLFGAFLAASSVLLISSYVFYVETPINSLFYEQLGVEILLTFVLALVAYVAWIGNPNHKSVATYSFIMGFTLVALYMMAENISGAVFNPAISLGTSVLDYFLGGASYKDIPVYTIAPVIGATLAAFFYKFILDDEY